MRIALLLLLLASPSAHAIKLSVAGAMNYAKPETAGNYEAKSATGYGAFLEFGFIPPLIGLELGALQLTRKYATTAGSETITSFKGYQYPVLLRANLGFLSFGLGGYWMQYKGSVSRESPQSGVATSSTFADSNLTTSDFGLASSLRLSVDLAPLFRVFGEGRYNMGLKDNDPGAAETKFTEMMGLAGLQVGF
ncbi:MAG: hypothetical protein HUU37_08095 [Bdellovibrionales bacterium]|nr:hypothetical protein [Bdellovibrionales bacterium]